MRIKTTKNNNNKKRNILIICTIVILLILGGAGWFYYTYSDNNPSTNISSDQKTKSTKDEDKDKQVTNNETPVSDKDTPSTDSSPTNSDSSTGVVTPSTKPGNTDPYPVTNEHYQIKQISTTNFEITLFPVINNPEYADYNSQLRAYKKEALDYLTNRYGSIDGFGIDWNPDDAENL